MAEKPPALSPMPSAAATAAPHLQHPWSLDAWLDSIKHARSSASAADPVLTRRLLEEAVTQFPTVVGVWRVGMGSS
jgi:hypothetical protein